MSILTTTIGAYPKPAGTPVPDWFARGVASYGSNPTREWESAMDRLGDEVETAFADATQAVITDQTNAGIDIPTDDEIRRDNYIYYHCRHLQGIDFEQMTQRTFRDGTETGLVPTIRDHIRATYTFLADEFSFAQRFTDKPVKITMPGPLTIADTLQDEYYGDKKRLSSDIADALNHEVRGLAERGCRHIQIDEPVFVRQLDNAFEFGFENLDRAFHGCPDEVVRTVHMCCSYPDSLDNPDYPKGPPDSYKDLVDAIEASSIMAVSMEDAHEHIDLSVLEKLSTTIVILGVVAIGMSRVESVEEIKTRLSEALSHIDADRLMAAPDCGLGLLGRDLSLKKLTNMSVAARTVQTRPSISSAPSP